MCSRELDTRATTPAVYASSACGNFRAMSHDANDQARFLGRTHGYAQHATVDALECLREDEQQNLSNAARNAERSRRLEAARTTRERVVEAVDDFEQSATLPPKLRSSARAVRRSADALLRNTQRLS